MELTKLKNFDVEYGDDNIQTLEWQEHAPRYVYRKTW